MTLADLALDGSTGLEKAEPRSRRTGRRLFRLVAIAALFGLIAAWARHQHESLDVEDADGF